MSRRAKPRSSGQANRRSVTLAQALKDLPRATCFNPEKVKYRSLKTAESAAEKQWITDRRLLKPYPCGSHYHLTSRSLGEPHGH